MGLELATVAAAIGANPVLLLIIVLCVGATMVNGATDAPNAIATVVGTRAMRPTPAIIMAAVCNFIGLVGITAISTAVAGTIFGMSISAATTKPRLSLLPLLWWLSSCGALQRGRWEFPRARAIR